MHNSQIAQNRLNRQSGGANTTIVPSFRELPGGGQYTNTEQSKQTNYLNSLGASNAVYDDGANKWHNGGSKSRRRSRSMKRSRSKGKRRYRY